MDITARINNIIIKKGLKKQSVASHMGKTPKQFSDMLNGRRTIKWNDVLLICNALDVSPNELLGYNETS